MALQIGTILHDSLNEEWELGNCKRAENAFVEVYRATKVTDNKSKYVIFMQLLDTIKNDNHHLEEIEFYRIHALEYYVSLFKTEKDLLHLGICVCIAFGNHTFENKDYKFVVFRSIPSQKIWRMYQKNCVVIPPANVCFLAIQMLHSLEYIHRLGYIHGNIQGSEVRIIEQDYRSALLVGLNCLKRYSTNPQYIVNPMNIENVPNDGYLKYCSRDAHQGVATRRGDIEMLIFNMIDWLYGSLPWQASCDTTEIFNLKQQKMMTFTNPPNDDMDMVIKTLLSYVNTIQHDEAPDYQKIEGILLRAIEATGTLDTQIIFKRHG